MYIYESIFFNGKIILKCKCHQWGYIYLWKGGHDSSWMKRINCKSYVRYLKFSHISPETLNFFSFFFPFLSLFSILMLRTHTRLVTSESLKVRPRYSVSSIAQSCPTLCDPVNHSTPGLPVHHQLPESTQTHVSWWCHPTISSSVPFSSCPQSFPASGSFQMSQLFTSGGQSIGVSASTSVLTMNTQDWSPLGWTGWISLQSKGLSRVFSNTTVQKHQFFCAQLSL